ncbi:hypothetical protein [Oceaniglobus trochenteri]|uniref:hypothetical protein n=1 Tax=Oceaniglobus trochenteri TaxID=2763260 RepID=UPI001CFFB1C7|nr:hypothetical protein [Oceaniglobus trochenteri]
MKKPLLASLVASTLFVSACAEQPDQVTRTYVSPTSYQHLNCGQLMSERTQLVAQVNTLTGAQKKKADNDAAMMAVGMVLFWPALFGLAAGTDHAVALSVAKGQFEAIQEAGLSKGCFRAA